MTRIRMMAMMIAVLSLSACASRSEIGGASALMFWGGLAGVAAGCEQPCGAIAGLGFLAGALAN